MNVREMCSEKCYMLEWRSKFVKDENSIALEDQQMGWKEGQLAFSLGFLL